MKRFITIIILSALFAACKPGIPKDIIQPIKMEKVLFDIHVVDGYISTLPSQDSAKLVASSFYKGVYKKFGIDSALYNRSLGYYYKHPPILKKMYDSVVVELNRLKDQNSRFASVVPENSFKGMFAKEGLDSTALDQTLNRKYNYIPLKENVYGKFMGVGFSPNTTLQPAQPSNQPLPAISPQTPKLQY